MTGKQQQNEQQDELRDLDVPEQDAEGVKGGGGGDDLPMESISLNVKVGPPRPPGVLSMDHNI